MPKATAHSEDQTLAARYVTRPIIRIDADGRRAEQRALLREECVTFFCDGVEAATFHCLPFDLEALAVGYLYSTKRVDAYGHIAGMMQAPGRIEVRLQKHKSPVLRTPVAEIRFTAADVHRLSENFDRRCDLFRRTGAAHACALADESGILLFMEDVARHHALDKVIGAMLQQGITPDAKALLFSGRLAEDMVARAARCGVRVLIAPGAPTLAAVECAENAGLTLLGFVRSGSMNVYCHAHRLD